MSTAEQGAKPQCTPYPFADAHRLEVHPECNRLRDACPSAAVTIRIKESGEILQPRDI